MHSAGSGTRAPAPASTMSRSPISSTHTGLQALALPSPPALSFPLTLMSCHCSLGFWPASPRQQHQPPYNATSSHRSSWGAFFQSTNLTKMPLCSESLRASPLPTGQHLLSDPPPSDLLRGQRCPVHSPYLHQLSWGLQAFALIHTISTAPNIHFIQHVGVWFKLLTS